MKIQALSIMENSNKIFNDILSKLQETLGEFKCKSEVQVSEKEAILYGKFSHYMEKYSIVIHVKEQDYTPVRLGAGGMDAKEIDTQKIIMPSLDVQSFKAQQSNRSPEEQYAIRDKFAAEADEIGKEFMRKMRKS